MNKICKVKKLQEEEKEIIFNSLIDKKTKINIIENDEFYEQLNNLEKEFKIKTQKLEKQIETQKKYYEKQMELQMKLYDEKIKNIISKNISKNNIKNNTSINNNNIIINSNKLVKFGSEDVSKIDTEDFTNTIINFTGKNCFIELANKIFNNDKHPEHKTIYMNDKNRNQFMAFDGKSWILDDEKVLFTVSEKLKEFIDLKQEELEELIKKDPKFRHKLKINLIKYYNMYYDETDDEPEKRKKEFKKLVDDNLIALLYNIRELVKTNYNKLVEESNKLLLLEK